MTEFCDYCDGEIDTETYGWGWFRDEFGQMTFHTECLEIEEGVIL